MESRITLGRKVRDVVSTLEGIATSRVEFLNGCVRYAVQPPVDKDGRVPEAVYVDVEQLQVVDDGVRAALSVSPPTGGPRPDPQRAPDPTAVRPPDPWPRR